MKKTNNPVAKYARDFNKAVVMKDRKKAQKKGDRKHKGKYQEDTDVVEDKKGLWDRIRAKRKRGEAPAKPGDKDYPKTLDVGESVEQIDEAKMGTVDKKTLKKLISDVMNFADPDYNDYNDDDPEEQLDIALDEIEKLAGKKVRNQVAAGTVKKHWGRPNNVGYGHDRLDMRHGSKGYNKKSSKSSRKWFREIIQNSLGYHKKAMKGKLPESVEQVDEISKGLKSRYMTKAQMDAFKKVDRAHRHEPESPESKKHMASAMKRGRGMALARKKMKEEVEQIDEGVGQFSVKKRKSTIVRGNDKEFIPDVKETEFDIVHKGKVVGDLRTDDYLAYIHGSLYGKDLPELSNYGTHRSSGITSTLHAFLKSKTGQKWATTGKLRGKNILESVEQVEGKNTPNDGNPCWDTHKKVGTKMKGGKRVNDCVPKNEEVEQVEAFMAKDTPARDQLAGKLLKHKKKLQPAAYKKHQSNLTSNDPKRIADSLKRLQAMESVEQVDEARAPSTVKHKGKTYYQTGKQGKDSKTGSPSFEYSSDQDGDDVRVWYNSKTKKVAMESAQVDEELSAVERRKHLNLKKRAKQGNSQAKIRLKKFEDKFRDDLEADKRSAKQSTKAIKGKGAADPHSGQAFTGKGSGAGDDDNLVSQLRKAQDVDGKLDIRLPAGNKTARLPKALIDKLLAGYDRLQKPEDKKKFKMLLTKELRKKAK